MGACAHFHAKCRDASASASKSGSMPPALAFNGSVLQSDPVLPPARPAFGQVQDTALQRETPTNNIGPQSHRLQTTSSYDHTASGNSVDHYNYPAVSQHIERRGSLGNASEISPQGGHSLSDGIPPAFETSSSCAASASALSPMPGRQFSINLATGMPPSLVCCLSKHKGWSPAPQA